MNMKISSVIEYVTLFLKKYGEVQQAQMQNTFRVASIKNSAKGTKIIFQVIGKSTFMECSPAEIISNDAFLERFSKKDIQKITYTHSQEENLKNQKTNPDIKVAEQAFNFEEGKTKFSLTDQLGNTVVKSATEITLDKKIIPHLSQQDAMSIGYIAGYEHSQNNSTE